MESTSEVGLSHSQVAGITKDGRRISLLVLGAGKPIPTFVFRRLELLVRFPIKAIVFNAYHEHLKYLRNSIVIKSPSFKYLRIRPFLKILTHPTIFLRLLTVARGDRVTIRLKWTIKMLSLATLKEVDVIHIQWLSSTLDYAWLRKFFKVPIIASARGSELTIFAETESVFKERIQSCLKVADYIHCVSKDMYARCIQLGADPQKLFVNYNGIDVEKFAPRDDNIERTKKTDPFILISIGSLIPRKGFPYQLLLLRNLLATGKNVVLWIIGEGQDRAAIQYQAVRLGVTKNVKLWGQLSEERVIGLLNSADIYISTSYAEGLSNSVLEAAAVGLPVIVFNCEGMIEIVEHGRTGFIVDYGDIEGMKENVLSVIQNRKLRHSMSANAREKVKEEFDARVWSNKMYEFYRSVSQL